MDARNRDTQEQPTKEIHEVVGVFDNLAALQSAIDQLLTDGFDQGCLVLNTAPLFRGTA